MRAAMDLTLTDLKTIVAIIEASPYRAMRLVADGAHLTIDGDGRRAGSLVDNPSTTLTADAS
jgi:hypothetical protein